MAVFSFSIAEIIGALYCADSAERNNSKYPFVAEKAGTKAYGHTRPEALFRPNYPNL